MNPLRFVSALIGFLAAVLAIARGDSTLVWVAIGLLGTSFGVRVVQRIQRKRDDSETDSSP